MEAKPDEKKQKLLGALEQGLTQVHLDPRRPGVLVPAQYRGDQHLVLNLSYRFDPPDLTVSDWGVRQTLSFNGSRFTVGVPWSALYAIASHATREFWMYPDDMPPEMLEGAVERQNVAAATQPSAEAGTPRAILREVVMERSPQPADSDGEPGAEAPEEPAQPTPPKRGHLRLVK